MVRKNILIHKGITRNCTVFILRRELTPSAILWGQLADRVSSRRKRKTGNFKACLYGSLFSTFKLSNHMHFITNGFKRIFKDQLDRSKETCSFIFHHFAFEKPNTYYLYIYTYIY